MIKLFDKKIEVPDKKIILAKKKVVGPAGNTKFLFFDRGDHTHVAQRLGRDAGNKVYYIYPMIGANPRIKEDQIGEGLQEIEKIDDFWKYVDKVDHILFPSCYDGEFCAWLNKKGYSTFGSGLSADLEINRIRFLETLEEVGLPVAKLVNFEDMDDYKNEEYITVLTVGLDELEECLIKRYGKDDSLEVKAWIKIPYCRGDFDTKKFVNMAQIEGWITEQRYRLGKRGSETIELLVQDHIKADCESGDDVWNLNGEIADYCTIGYEAKDDGYCCRIIKQPPKILKHINDKLAPVFKKLGYQGQMAVEVRIVEDGRAFCTDLTARIGSPPGPIAEEQYINYPKDVKDIASGRLPDCEFDHDYGVQLVLRSSEAETKEVSVQFPKECEPYVKLKNNYRSDGINYCVPNDCKDGFFGDIAVVGDELKKCQGKALEVAEQIIVEGLEYNKNAFKDIDENIKRGEKFGIFL